MYLWTEYNDQFDLVTQSSCLISPLPSQCWACVIWDTLGVHTFYEIMESGMVGWEGVWQKELGTGRVAKQFGFLQGLKESRRGITGTVLAWDHGEVFLFLFSNGYHLNGLERERLQLKRKKGVVNGVRSPRTCVGVDLRERRSSSLSQVGAGKPWAWWQQLKAFLPLPCLKVWLGFGHKGMGARIWP